MRMICYDVASRYAVVVCWYVGVAVDADVHDVVVEYDITRVDVAIIGVDTGVVVCITCVIVYVTIRYVMFVVVVVNAVHVRCMVVGVLLSYR